MPIPDHTDPSLWRVEFTDNHGVASCGHYRARFRFPGGGPLRLVWETGPDAESSYSRLGSVVREACYRALGANAG